MVSLIGKWILHPCCLKKELGINCVCKGYSQSYYGFDLLTKLTDDLSASLHTVVTCRSVMNPYWFSCSPSADMFYSVAQQNTANHI